VALKNRGAAWQAILQEAVRDLDPRWTLVGRGSRAVLTWGRVGWVWQFVGLNLESGDLHELYASRSWLDQPFARSIEALARDLLSYPSPDRHFVLERDDAPDQVRRWAALVPDQVFTDTLKDDLARLEWHFDLFLTEDERLPWMPLAGLRLLLGHDPRPVVDEAVAFLSATPGSKADRPHPELEFWREFRHRLDSGRDETLAWLDRHRRTALKAERVPEDLVEPGLDLSSTPN
jgi:hypothetical protein